MWFDSEANFEPENVASTSLLDQRTPNAELCMSYGSSAMVFDERVFVSFNPFNIYVTQPEVKVQHHCVATCLLWQMPMFQSGRSSRCRRVGPSLACDGVVVTPFS